MWRLIVGLEKERSAFIFNGQRIQDPFIFKIQGAQVSVTLQNQGTSFIQTSEASNQMT
jgi:hypothetical protein